MRCIDPRGQLTQRGRLEGNLWRKRDAERLLDAGYYTQGFPNNTNITRAYGFDKGFIGYEYLAPDMPFFSTPSVAHLVLYEVLRRFRVVDRDAGPLVTGVHDHFQASFSGLDNRLQDESAFFVREFVHLAAEGDGDPGKTMSGYPVNLPLEVFDDDIAFRVEWHRQDRKDAAHAAIDHRYS